MALSKIVRDSLNTGIDDNSDATAITIDSSERVGIATPATSNARCLLHTHPSGTGSIPTNYLVQQDDNNLGLVIMNTNDSATYSGLRIETRSNQAAGWLVANEFQSAFNGDLVFRARNAGSTSAEIARMKSSGGLTFNGDTAAANALNDYEEGTFTATLNGGSNHPSSRLQTTGQYTKVGNKVTVSFEFNNVTTTGSPNYAGQISVFGMPFAASDPSGTVRQVSGSVASYSAATWDSASSGLFARLGDGATEWYFYANHSNDAWYPLQHSPGTNRYLLFNATYITG